PGLPNPSRSLRRPPRQLNCFHRLPPPPPTIIGFFRTGPYLLFDENSKGSDVERIAGKKLPVTLRSNRSMDWLYRIEDAGVAEGWSAEGSDAGRPRMVTGLPQVYGRIRKSALEVKLGNGRTIKKVNLTYGAVISLGEYVVDDEPSQAASRPTGSLSRA
ncbi:MAG: hypothetical protein LC749_03210, partial [Actinobacteria bacterium]|nr:hypothetical protein [Actinomycetota bacterium]